jgi:hypothetical protein
MSVGIVVKVSEGLVLGADSASTLHGRIERPDGAQQEGVVKIFHNSKKLLQIGDFPIGFFTWGQAFLGSRTIESLVREWEHNNGWQSRDDRKARDIDHRFTVQECAEGLREHLIKFYEEQFGEQPREKRPVLGVVIAGYSQNAFFPEIWRSVFPVDDHIVNQRPDKDGKPDFGANWYGLADAIVRLHWGRDDRVIKIIAEGFGIPEDEIQRILEPLEYQIPFAVMPLQDAIEYTHYMINVAVGRYRFVAGPELCGGEIDVAAITQREFRWISRQSWKL